MAVIFWDIDDVLNDLMRRWFEDFWLKEHPQCKLNYSDLKENPPHNILKIDKKEYLASLDNYRRNFYQFLKPRKEIIDWLKKYGSRTRHMAITSSPLSTAPISAQWVFSHFGEWIRTIHVIPSLREEDNIVWYDKSKGNFLKWLSKNGVLVDDNNSNFSELNNSQIKHMLWPQPWNDSNLTILETLEFLTDILFSRI